MDFDDDEDDGLDYENAEPGMREAVERQRKGGEMTLPELDFSGASDPEAQAEGSRVALAEAFRKGSSEPDDDLRDLQTQPTGSATAQPQDPFKEPAPVDEYTAALRKIKATLSKPTPDYSKGYAVAQSRDAKENRVNRILDYLSAGLRRAPTASLTPAATNASDFLKRQALEQQGSSAELARLGKLAQATKPVTPKTGKDPGNVEGLKAYLVKIGAGTPEEFDGMSEKQLGAVMQAYGLKHRIDREPVLDARADQAHRDSVRLTEAQLGYRKEHDTSEDTKELAGKLGNKAAFDSKYNELQAIAKANGGKVPGLGMLEGVKQQPGVIGSVARAVSPPTPEAIKGRKLLRQLAQDYANAISGAGVSNKERDQLNAATVDVDNDDSAIALSGLETLKEMYEAKAAQLKRGYRQDVVEHVEPPPSDAVEETRTIDGVQYHKRNGKWVTDG